MAPALSPSPASHARAAAAAVSVDPRSTWAASSALAERVADWELPQVICAAPASPATPFAGADSLGKISAEDLTAAARAAWRQHAADLLRRRELDVTMGDCTVAL